MYVCSSYYVLHMITYYYRGKIPFMKRERTFFFLGRGDQAYLFFLNLINYYCNVHSKICTSTYTIYTVSPWETHHFKPFPRRNHPSPPPPSPIPSPRLNPTNQAVPVPPRHQHFPSERIQRHFYLLLAKACPQHHHPQPHPHLPDLVPVSHQIPTQTGYFHYYSPPTRP